LENSDDTRNTPSKTLYDLLKDECTDVVVHDPYVEEEEGVDLTSDLEDALKGKNAVVLVTNHEEYNSLTPEKFKVLMKSLVIIDGRNVYDQDAFKNAGFIYRGVGKGSIYKQ
jgi:UDP-N-acetyl-D-mannosaminuronic acid dehydrogenase